MKNSIIGLLIIAVITSICACKGFLQVDAPANQIVDEKIYANDETANSAIRGIYGSMMNGSGFASGGANSVTLLAGRSADDFTNYLSVELSKQFSDNNLLPGNTILRTNIWQEAYRYIFFANTIIENLQISKGVSASTKTRLDGEAKFIRAFCHFYLTNLFGEVPLVRTTDYKVNLLASANTKEEIYTQIVQDLRDAKAQLSESYPSVDRVRPNKWAAVALLSRAYLFQHQWLNAEQEASVIIENKSQYQLAEDLDQVFLKNSKEAILQLPLPGNATVNTREGNLFILTAAPGPSTHVVLSDNLLSAFEPGDLRFDKWVGVFKTLTSSWYYPLKYKVKTGALPSLEYSMVLRLAEQYLIRAEARIQQDKIQLGIDDLNHLRRRARAKSTTLLSNPLPDLSISVDKAEALRFVEKERRIELFAEWGHRWLDLKRTNRVDDVLKLIKGANWESTDALYPIPSNDILNGPNLKQNPGYE